MLSFTNHKIILNRIANKYFQQIAKLLSFVFLYCLICFLVIPSIAKPFGRVPLPAKATNHLKALNIFTCIFNRNYVRPELRQTAFEVANKMNEQFPGTEINFLDAGFPFMNGFPLFPHLSHNDGKKLDVSFCYRDSKNNTATNECPSFMGYGICEEPLPGEKNTADFCSGNGYWQYSMMRRIISQDNKKNFIFDAERTKALVNLFARQDAIGKIFIEPHLKIRLGLTTDKIRFHGCQAVRHDDHIHV